MASPDALPHTRLLAGGCGLGMLLLVTVAVAMVSIGRHEVETQSDARAVEATLAAIFTYYLTFDRWPVGWEDFEPAPWPSTPRNLVDDLSQRVIVRWHLFRYPVPDGVQLIERRSGSDPADDWVAESVERFMEKNADYLEARRP